VAQFLLETRSELSEPEDVVKWTTTRSAELYQIRGWGEPYFSVSERGTIQVTSDPAQPNRKIDLHDLVGDLEARGLDMPLLIRFSDILRDRIRRLNECFIKAITEYNYPGSYRGVFPVKVNQQKHLIDEVVEFGSPWRYGLEAGSKPELLIALSAISEPGGLIICNGYKDHKYIETALLAQRFGKTIIVVLERPEELDFALAAAQKTGIRPTLGVRAKLSSRGVGRWKDSAGDRAKFGLTVSEIVDVCDRLTQCGMLDCLQLLHFHIGSQISSIIPIKNAMQEAANLFVELAKLGADMKYLDVGGGLAVDYDGSKSDYHASKNYNVQEYANDVVAGIQEACGKANLPCPVIVTESGRAVSAHQSVLVFEVVGTHEVRTDESSDPGPQANRVLRLLYETMRNVQPKNLQEALHDAQQSKEEAESLFKLGFLSLRERGQAERLFWACCAKIAATGKRLKRVPEEVAELHNQLAAIYYGNFSVFQSVPDSWAIDQLFPVMPIHRLDEEPTVRCVLADLTCDSDGKIDHFIDVEEPKPVLEVHPVRPNEPYRLAVFLTGAYQEILGDLHNLFGDTNAVHVRLSDTDDDYEVSHVVRGDSIHEVLDYVEYDPRVMVERIRLQAERAKREGRITVDQVKLLLKHYEESLASYTYLTDD
jgi:arginine decarboxylase